MKKVLLLGPGRNLDKRLNAHSLSFYSASYNLPPDEELTVIDIDSHACDEASNENLGTTFEWDLNDTPWPVNKPIHVHAFDEVHAYEVLEHLGKQGDAKSFFDTFSEIWWALKPGGLLFASVPSWKSIWAWGDPTHSRIINMGSLTFLFRAEYEKQVGRTAMSDYRRYLVGDWQLVAANDDGESFRFVLRAK